MREGRSKSQGLNIISSIKSMSESGNRVGAAITESARGVPERLVEAVQQHRRGSGCISDAIREVHAFQPKMAEKIRRHQLGRKFVRQTTVHYWTRLLREDAAIRSCNALKASNQVTSAELRLESDRRSRDRIFGNMDRRRDRIKEKRINDLIRVAAPLIDAELPVYFVTITPGGPPATALSLIDSALDTARRQSIAFSGFIEVENSGALSFHGLAFSIDFKRQSRVCETKRAFADGLISRNFPRAVRGPAIDVRRISTYGSLVRCARYTYKSYGTPRSEARRLGLGQRTLFRFCKWQSLCSKDLAGNYLSQSLNPSSNSPGSSREQTLSILAHADGNKDHHFTESTSSKLVDAEYVRNSSPDPVLSFTRLSESEFKTGKPGPRRIQASDVFASSTLATLIILFKSIYKVIVRSSFSPVMIFGSLGSEAPVESDYERPSPASAITLPKRVPPRSRGPPCVTPCSRVVSHSFARVTDSPA